MFYLLASLTFLTSILIYSLYPHSDGVTRIDIPSAKTAAMELVTQHSAALQAATVLRMDENSNQKMRYEDWGSGQITSAKYGDFLPSVFTPNPNPSYLPYSQVLCVDNTTGGMTSICARRNADIANDIYGTTDFVVTHISLASIAETYGSYIANLTPKALGQITYFTDYDPKRHLTTNCGLVQSGRLTGKDFDPNNATYYLTDTRYETVNLPLAFTDTLYTNQKYIACITRVSVAYDNETQEIVTPKARSN